MPLKGDSVGEQLSDPMGFQFRLFWISYYNINYVTFGSQPTPMPQLKGH